jgi:hypothetical protein
LPDKNQTSTSAQTLASALAPPQPNPPIPPLMITGDYITNEALS